MKRRKARYTDLMPAETVEFDALSTKEKIQRLDDTEALMDQYPAPTLDEYLHEAAVLFHARLRVLWLTDPAC